MKKIFNTIVLSVVLLSVTCFTASCGIISNIFQSKTSASQTSGGRTQSPNKNTHNPVNNDKDETTILRNSLISFGAGMLKDCFADISDKDVSLAIELRTKETVAKNNKGYLVTFDDQNKLRKVNFIYENVKTTQEIDSEDNVVTEKIEITQEELKASLVNIYVTEKFTYMMFVPIGYDLESHDLYTKNSVFFCDENHQSFIMDNETYKLYPTNDIGAFSKINENYIQVTIEKKYSSYDFENAKYYELSVDKNNGLVATKLISNDNIKEESVAIDKFGNVFVKNSSVNQKDGKYLYYTGNSKIVYIIGNDGYVYSVLETGFYLDYCAEIRRFESDLSSNLISNSVTLRGSDFLIKDNKLYTIMDTSIDDNDYVSDVFLYYRDIVNGKALGDYKYCYDFDAGAIYYLVGEEIFTSKVVDGNKTLYYFDTKRSTYTQLIDTFVEIDYSGKIPVLTKELLTGTQKFNVIVRNGTATSEMFMDISYEKNIVTIQPLN